MAWFCQDGDGQVTQWFVQRGCNVSQVGFQRQVQVDGPFCARTDNQLFHVHVWRVQETAFIAYSQHRQRIRLAHCRHTRAFDRIDGDVDRITVAGSDFLADKQHRRFINLTLANHDGAVDVDLVEHNTHGVHRRAISGIFIAAAQPFIASQRGRFGHA